MKVLVVNPVVYTSETKNIKRVDSMKDTMIYDFCLAFKSLGYDVCLYAAKPFEPIKPEQYPFEVIWGVCVCEKVFMPHCFPFMPSLYRYIKENKSKYDLIICSEVFSMNSLISVIAANEKTIIWHELAKHNRMMMQIPSKFWYGVIARIFMRNTKVIARSPEARAFISKYCAGTVEDIIDHGVNLEKFRLSKEKKKKFIVCSQLIARKKIDGIIQKFKAFLKKYDSEYELYIIGEGDKREELETIVRNLDIESKVVFTGMMTHDELLPYLSESKALLVNTEKDNNMISIIESIAVGTPIVTTPVPLNATYIKKYSLGVVGEWNEDTLNEVVVNNEMYVDKCVLYRKTLSTTSKAEAFIAHIK